MNYIVKRTGQAILTVFTVISISFVLIRLMPGGPVDALVTRLIKQGYSTSAINSMVKSYLSVNPQKPLLPAYIDYMMSILQGDFGKSLETGQPVFDTLMRALPWTLFYASISLLLSFVIGVLLGAMMAYKEGTTFDYVGTFVSIVINSTPFYIFGVIVLALFAYQYNIFPTGGQMADGTSPGFNLPFILGLLHHAALPITTSAFLGFGGFALGMRGNSISVLGEDYLRVGRLRGLSENRIAVRYVGRNAILPLYTRLMLSLGAVVGGSVILEKIFRYPGVGYRMFQAVIGRDLPLMMGSFILISLAIVVGIFVADLTYSRLDPRAGTPTTTSTSTTKLFSLATLRKLRWNLRRALGVGSDGDSTQSSDDRQGAKPPRETSPLQSTTRSQMESRRERYHRTYDELVRAPFRTIWSDWRTRLGVSILSFYVLMGTVGVMIVEPTGLQEVPPLVEPFHDGWITFDGVVPQLHYPLGSDANGQDIMALVVHATPAMLKMILSGAVFATILATIVGTLTGYLHGSLVDQVLTTATDVAMTIPGLPLIMVLAVTIEPGNPYMVGLLLTITTWAGTARTLRSEVLKIRQEEYVAASSMMGASTPSIIVSDVIPNLMPFILVSFVGAGRRVIFGSVGLYFLGVLPFSNLNWGIILNQAYEYGALIVPRLMYWLLIPMLTIMILSLGMILTAQGMDRLFNPRIRARHEKNSTSSTEPSEETSQTQVPISD